MERRGGFSNEDKQYVRDRANKHCEFGDGDCPRPNTNRVNHLTGCFQGRLQSTPEQWVNNVKENATMQCEPHERLHDVEEQRAIEQLLEYKRNDIGIYRHPDYSSVNFERYSSDE